MITTFTGGVAKLWLYTTDPDTSVQTSLGFYANEGEMFLNTTNNNLWLCLQGGSSQIWIQMAYQSSIPATPPSRSQSSASRSLNSAFQISSTRDCFVNYSVDIATAITLTTGQSGTVILEIASDSGFTTNVQELGRLTNSQTGTLTIGLALNQTVTANVGGYVPPAYYVRLRTVNNTSTPTFTYRSGQEVLL